MNNTSPLVPQGAIPPRPKNSLYFKILMVLSLHVVIIGGMLLQGCKDTSNTTAKQQDAGANIVDSGLSNGPTTMPISTTNPTDPLVTVPSISNNNGSVTSLMTPGPTAAPTSTVPSYASSSLVVPSSTPTYSAPVVTPTPTEPVGDVKEYIVAKGDTLAVIAHKNGISLKSLEAANQGVNPRKLHAGQKLQVPTAGAVASSSSTPSTAGAMKVASMSPSGAGDVYVVKSGDTLSKIAKTHGVTFKKIMAMNDLKTTSIHAGQKLKMPAAKTTAEPSTTPSNTVPTSTSTGMKVSSVTPATTPLAKN